MGIRGEEWSRLWPQATENCQHGSVVSPSSVQMQACICVGSHPSITSLFPLATMPSFYFPKGRTSTDPSRLWLDFSDCSNQVSQAAGISVTSAYRCEKDPTNDGGAVQCSVMTLAFSLIPVIKRTGCKGGTVQWIKDTDWGAPIIPAPGAGRGWYLGWVSRCKGHF